MFAENWPTLHEHHTCDQKKQDSFTKIALALTEVETHQEYMEITPEGAIIAN